MAYYANGALRLEQIDASTFEMTFNDAEFRRMGSSVVDQIFASLIFGANQIGLKGYQVEGIETFDDHTISPSRKYRFHVDGKQIK